MEIEAKFVVSTEEMFNRLQSASDLAGFSLSAGQARRLHDTYLDTPDRSILAAGYACRRRERDDETTMFTLKGLERTEGAIHRREELEVLSPQGLPPSQWPASPVRDRVLELIGDAPLVPVFDLRQTRVVRPLRDGERLVAELSLDDVHLAVGDNRQSYFELEVELAPDGAEEELVSIASCLQKDWGLQAESRSKFERALVFVAESLAPDRLLTVEERAICTQLAERDDLHGRRAMALLALDGGASQKLSGEQAGMSERRVRYWQAQFCRQRLAVFPDRVLASVGATPAASPPAGSTKASGPRRRTDRSPQPWPMGLLFEHYEVDRSHARSVAGFALALFDHLLPIHGLPPERRRLLETAALVHDIGFSTNSARTDMVGHDILLAHPPAGLSDRERQMVAATTLLHRRPITAKNLEKLIARYLGTLPESAQRETLVLAALVRMADGMDYSQGSSQLGGIQQKKGGVQIALRGPFAAVDAEKAQELTDMWHLLFDVRVRFAPTEGAGVMVREPLLPVEVTQPDVVAETAEPLETPGLEPDDTMAEAARKTLLFHFQRMWAHEAGTRAGEDAEDLHDMRVATRRMRAAMPVFSDYLDMERMRPFVKGMRRTGRALGAVRDLDVFQQKARKYLKDRPRDRRSELDPLLRVLTSQREVARERMLAYLDGERYALFVQQFGEFLQTPGAGASAVDWQQDGPRPHRLRHTVPIAVYRRLADVWAYDEWMTGAEVPLERYHQLRITSKGLRYTLEYFREVLGPEAEVLIEEVKALQDNLGDLQDAVVACNLLRDFLTWGTWGHVPKQRPIPAALVIAPGVVAYLANRQMELQRLLGEFPSVWRGFHGSRFKQLLMQAVAVL